MLFIFPEKNFLFSVYLNSYHDFLVIQKNKTWETFFLKNNTQNVVEKLLLDPSLKFKIEHISGSIVSSFVQFVFFASQANSHRNILKLSCRPLAFISYKFFEKTITGLELISLPHFLFSNFLFSPWFLKKNIYLFILY